MPTASRHRTLTRLHAVTGAPALVLGWAPALWVLAGVPGRAAHEWLPSAPVLTTWWLSVALSALAHVVLGLVLGRAAHPRRQATQAAAREAAAPATEDQAVSGGLSDAGRDEGRTLRLGTGALTLASGASVLAIMAPATFGQASPAEAYQALDACFAVLPGVGFACVAGAAGGLYVADELPRAVRVLGGRGGSAQRATFVFSLALGALLFVASMSCVSHFSVGGAPLGTPAEVAP